jgi:fatty acid desaturase
MAAVDPAAEQLFVGLEDAETHLPERWMKRRERLENAAVIAFIVAVQLAWLAAFVYAAYLFVF